LLTTRGPALRRKNDSSTNESSYVRIDCRPAFRQNHRGKKRQSSAANPLLAKNRDDPRPIVLSRERSRRCFAVVLCFPGNRGAVTGIWAWGVRESKDERKIRGTVYLTIEAFGRDLGRHRPPPTKVFVGATCSPVFPRCDEALGPRRLCLYSRRSNARLSAGSFSREPHGGPRCRLRVYVAPPPVPPQRDRPVTVCRGKLRVRWEIHSGEQGGSAVG